MKSIAAKLNTEIPTLFLAKQSEKTPWYAKALACVTVGYALSPIDLIPDFIPILSYLDDFVILPLLAAISMKLIPNEVMEDCREEAENMWVDGKPKKWYYAIPIIVVRLLVIFLIVIAIVKRVK